MQEQFWEFQRSNRVCTRLKNAKPLDFFVNSHEKRPLGNPCCQGGCAYLGKLHFRSISQQVFEYGQVGTRQLDGFHHRHAVCIQQVEPTFLHVHGEFLPTERKGVVAQAFVRLLFYRLLIEYACQHNGIFLCQQ